MYGLHLQSRQVVARSISLALLVVQQVSVARKYTKENIHYTMNRYIHNIINKYKYLNTI